MVWSLTLRCSVSILRYLSLPSKRNFQEGYGDEFYIISVVVCRTEEQRSQWPGFRPLRSLLFRLPLFSTKKISTHPWSLPYLSRLTFSELRNCSCAIKSANSWLLLQTYRRKCKAFLPFIVAFSLLPTAMPIIPSYLFRSVSFHLLLSVNRFWFWNGFREDDAVSETTSWKKCPRSYFAPFYRLGKPP